MKMVVVSSVIANKPLNGGNAWAVLNWVLGLQRLGLQVHFLEQIERRNCVDAAGAQAGFESCINRAYFARVTREADLGSAATLIYDGGAETHGRSYAELLDLTAEADLLINISGHLTLEPLKSHIRRKVYVDLDPGYTQFWHAAGYMGTNLAGHDAYVTIGANIGTSCRIPTGGMRWHHTRPPVVLERCPAGVGGDPGRFTTVASWRGAYGPVEFGGSTYGVKAHEFRKFMELPRRVPATLEIALDIHPADGKDSAALADHGWRLVDPKVAVPDPSSFHHYVQTSGAEFSAAQGVYVATESGWFSDRTARYLASGKPALVQDTGFGRTYPVGDGLLGFRTLPEAVEGVTRITGGYEHHCRAARALAEEYLDSDKVLGQLLDEIEDVDA